MYVPGGWWHTVLNLDLTVAVTHNYCSSATFPAIWAHSRRGRPKMSARWLAQVWLESETATTGDTALIL